MAKQRLAAKTKVGYLLLLCSLFGWIQALDYIGGYENEAACYGTNTGFTYSGDSVYRYESYKESYTNCTLLVGNLEIVSLDLVDRQYDLSFLSTIREITGYVLIAMNIVERVPLTSLQIIRGMTLYRHEKTNDSFSLFVALNYQVDGQRGLRELGFTSLSEILNGKAFFQNNNYLCYEDTIDWKDINPNTVPPVMIKVDNPHSNHTKCPPCHESCYNPVTDKRHCWGSGPNMCQKLTHGAVCHPNCQDSRCYGSLPNECCHPECAGGCTGPKKTDCFSCRNFLDEAGCVGYCPREIIYDKNQMMNVKNPNVKYAFGSVCVKECPGFLLQDSGFCVRQCSEGKHAKDQRNCEPCNGPCPRPCKGLATHVFLNSQNIRDFESCTSIDGNLRILSASFTRDPHYEIEALHPRNLSVLKHVKEITGYLLIQSNHSEFTDLSFLSSLEIIQGRITGPKGYALDIMSTPLRSLELVSLKSIRNGNVFIFNNRQLCYANTIDWTKVFGHEKQTALLNFNQKPEECESKGDVCDPQCGTSGCWGRGPDKCLKCANYVYEEKSLCLNRCTDIPNLYHKGDGKCDHCHPECNNSCHGPDKTDCDECKHVIMRNKENEDSCELKCGDTMYPDEHKICRPCDPFCGSNGCKGPSKIVGPNGCNSCETGMRMSVDGLIECMPPDTEECPSGFYLSQYSRRNGVEVAVTFRMCEKCHELCIACTGPTTQFCSECKYLRSGRYCVRECPNFFFGNNVSKMCEGCDKECRGGCYGPTSTDCFACSNFKIYLNIGNKTFNCTPDCPPSLPYRVKEEETDENRVVCADSSHPEVKAMKKKDAEEDQRRLAIILGCSMGGIVVLLVTITCICYFCHKRAQNNMKAAAFTAKIAGVDEMEPLTPTNAKPDLAKMRIINEEELRKGAIIGSGAFGTVYKGIWTPQGENVKIPVAIKVLQEGTSASQSTELLEEARVMCSVENMCCVRILAVCMKSQMMLVTQLMPHGNLLSYVRANKQHIGSKALLNWCTQIAKGMAYLEERGIVHRDLAARNVLVQTPNQVKITDFGLAKLLDSGSLEYHSSGGLMPIKWLALECIQHRIFTHKSDVWSFGITLWELFTLGEKPYDNVRTKDVPILLEKGERLQQPLMCTIDVYMIMVKCWMLDADSRPSFKELVEEFSKMSRDPGRYLVITGDELMRLPSMSYDKNELVHEISDGSGSIVEAEEYLQPVDQHRQLRPASMSHSPDRQLSNLSTSSMSHMMGNHLSPEGGAKGGKPGRDGQKVREKKYGHLTAAARAKKEREQPRHRGDSVSSRYSSDPIKFTKEKEEIDSGMDPNGPMYSSGEHLMGSPSSMDPRFPKLTPSMLLPVDKDDYLQPGAAAQSLAYLDLDGKGYYQNEREAVAEDTDPFSEEADQALNQSTSSNEPLHNGGYNNNYHPYSNHQEKAQGGSFAVNNPDYFEEGNDIWERKRPTKNGYHPIPTTSSSPVHTAAMNKDTTHPYYFSMNGGTHQNGGSSPQMVNTKVTLHGHRLPSTESNV